MNWDFVFKLFDKIFDFLYMKTILFFMAYNTNPILVLISNFSNRDSL